MEHITFCKGFCTCLDCEFRCEHMAEMVEHCRKQRHFAEITLTKNIDYRK